MLRDTEIGGNGALPILWPRIMTQQPIELILLRQWASYMAMPIWIADSDENVLYYNEPARKVT